MRFIDYFSFSAANLRRQKLRTGLNVMAVVIGAMAVVSLVSIAVGAQNFVSQQFASFGALNTVQVSAQGHGGGGPFSDGGSSSPNTGSPPPKIDDAVVTKIAAIPHVTAVSPQFQIGNMTSVALAGSSNQLSIQMLAITPNAAGNPKLQAGRQLSAGDLHMVILGAGYLKGLGYASNPGGAVGQTLVITTGPGFTGDDINPPQPQMGPGGGGPPPQSAPVQLKASIVGVAATGPNDGSLYVTSLWGRSLMTFKNWQPKGGNQPPAQNQTPGLNQPQPGPPVMELVTQDQLAQRGYDSVSVRTDSTTAVAHVAGSVRNLGFYASTGQDTINQLTSVLRIVGLVLAGVGAIALFISGIGIVNTMIMATYERTREIGIMRALGVSRRAVLALFTYEAGLIGLMGGAIGAGLAVAAGLVANSYLNRIIAQQGLDANNVITFPAWLFLGIVLFTTLLGLLAGLLP
ncbi:MAG TPA: ABC transporter permease, partial [Candidatus Dormibacteraeota bacterium]|nr:ABC transporter permease [Candidatus Dormibacteraeota bacterium]